MYESFKTEDPNELCGSVKTKITRKPQKCQDIEDTSRIPITAATGIGTADPLQFIYKGSPKTYVDLSDSEIYVECVLLHEDGSALEPKELVGTICGIGKLFPQIFFIDNYNF